MKIKNRIIKKIMDKESLVLSEVKKFVIKEIQDVMVYIMQIKDKLKKISKIKQKSQTFLDPLFIIVYNLIIINNLYG